MKQILINEIKKERCNAQALGAFNASVNSFDGSSSIGGQKVTIKEIKDGMIAYELNGKTKFTTDANKFDQKLPHSYKQAVIYKRPDNRFGKFVGDGNYYR